MKAFRGGNSAARFGGLAWVLLLKQLGRFYAFHIQHNQNETVSSICKHPTD
jgi:hypothetical protein